MSNEVGILLNPEAKAGWIPPKRESWLSGSLPTKVCGDGDGARPNSRNGAGVVTPELDWGLNNKLARVAPFGDWVPTTPTFPGARVAAVKPKAGPNTKGVEDSKLAGVDDSKGAGVDGPKGVKGTTLCGVETPKAPML